MRNRLVLLPGWGLGTASLEPLAASLRAQDTRLQIELMPLPELDHSDVQGWVDHLDRKLPSNVWLGGWSLGGMLASALAKQRGDYCCGLLTLASNPSFVARPDWPHGSHCWRARKGPKWWSTASGCWPSAAMTTWAWPTTLR